METFFFNAVQDHIIQERTLFIGFISFIDGLLNIEQLNTLNFLLPLKLIAKQILVCSSSDLGRFHKIFLHSGVLHSAFNTSNLIERLRSSDEMHCKNLSSVFQKIFCSQLHFSFTVKSLNAKETSTFGTAKRYVAMF